MKQSNLKVITWANIALLNNNKFKNKVKHEEVFYERLWRGASVW